MLQKMRSMRQLAALCAGLMLFLSLQPAAYADMVATEDLLAEQQAVIDRTTLLASLDRHEVREALIMRGVEPDNAKERVSNMTDQELASLNKQIDELPAGGGVLGTILLVMLILLLTDLAGWTDVYPRI